MLLFSDLQLDSVMKLRLLNDVCKSLGIHTSPKKLNGVWIYPLLSWYHQAITHPPFSFWRVLSGFCQNRGLSLKGCIHTIKVVVIVVVVKHQIQPQLSVFLFCTYPLWILADVADGGVGLLNHSVSLILVLDMKRN